MKIAAVIAEYNPFHNGHQSHIARTKAMGFDYVVCVMDGPLTQRGDFAHLSRWDRCRAALLGGADAVVDLPSLFACRSADCFASAGVALAHALGADALSFGCETDDLSLLRDMASLEEDAAFHDVIRAHLERGESQPRARAKACAERLGIPEERLPTGPNAILAVEYLRALRRIGEGAPQPVVIARTGEYHSRELGQFASASALRAAVSEGRADEAREGIPPESRFQLDAMAARHEADDLFLYALRSRGADYLSTLPDVKEGLENRVFSAAWETATLNDALESAKCKRYTRARLNRLAMHALTGLTAELAGRCPAPDYLRIVGARADAAPLLRELRNRATLPVRAAVELRDNPIFRFECAAADLWALTRNRPEERRAGQEFSRKFVRI